MWIRIVKDVEKVDNIWYLKNTSTRPPWSRKLVTDTTVEIYEELTPQLVKLIQDTKKNTELTEGQKQDEISLHMMGYVKSCTNEIIIQVLSEILGLEDEDEE